MASNIRINKVCENCQKEFEAKKTTTETCSDNCVKAYYNKRKRDAKIAVAQSTPSRMRYNKFEAIKLKEFLTVADLATLLNYSKRTAYNLIERGNMKAVNIAQCKSLVKRSDVDKPFQ